MNICEIKSNIKNGKYDNDFAMLYGDIDSARKRYINACE